MVLWFYAEPCRAEKYVQEHRRNMRWTELNGGYLVCGSMQNHAGPKNMCKKTGETCDGQSSMGGYLASRLIRYLNNVKV